jgi:hypothetical protein
MRSSLSANRALSAVCCTIFLFAGLPARSQETAPSDAEQQRMLAAITRYAEDYLAKLPDFICRQVTEEFLADKKGKHWRKHDTLTAKLVFSNGREQRTLELVNNKQVRDSRVRPRAPLSTEGEFGILLSKIFDEASQAKFSWGGWETVRGHRVARFDYAIDRAHSSMSLTNYIKAVVPYHGSVCGDPQTGAVWRVTSGTTEIPPEVQIKSIATTVEYDEVPIGSQKYLLPADATVLLAADQDQTRNEMQFRDYRKFEAESTITFGGGENQKPDTPQPQPPQ